MIESHLMSPLFQPLRVRATIHALSKIQVVGDWIVSAEALDADDNPLLPQYNFTGSEDETIARFEDALRSGQSRDDILRFVKREGALTPDNWIERSKVVSSGKYPDQVRNLARSQTASALYVANLGDLQDELKLLAAIAQLNTAVREERYSQVRPLAQEARLLLSQLQHVRIGNVPSDYVDPLELPEISPDSDRHHEDETEAETPTTKHASKVRRPRVKEGPLREAAAAVDVAFHRALRGLRVEYGRTGSVPGLVLEAESVRAVLYLTLIAQLDAAWTRCKRSDCPNVFRGKDRRKKFCSWHCSHLQYMREKRSSVRRSKTRTSKKGRK